MFVAVRSRQGAELAVIGDAIGDGEGQPCGGIERRLGLYADLHHL